MSIEFWMKSAETATREIIEWQDTSPSAGIQFVARPDSKVRWHIFGDGAVEMDSTTSVHDNVWHHVVGIRDADTSGGIMQLYVDSSQEGGNVDASSLGDITISSDVNIWVGGGNVTDAWEGSIDEIKWYDRALSAAEVLKNYKHGKSKHS